MELKLKGIERSVDRIQAFNQTRVELKLIYARFDGANHLAFNQTRVELKQVVQEFLEARRDDF